MAEIAFTAAATSTSSAPRSLAAGMPVSCWIRNFESVVRPRCMLATPCCSDFSRYCGGPEHAARANVVGLDGRQFLGGEHPLRIGKQAARLAQPGAVERVTHAAGVGEVRLADAMCQILLERRMRLCGEAIVLPLEELVGDAQQVGRRIVRKIQMVGDARAHAGVGAEERLHPLLVACKND